MASRRAREVGLRKVLGVQRWQLIVQFLSESVLISAAATALGILGAMLLLPAFESILGVKLSSQDVPPGFLLAFLPAVVLGIGIAAGVLPAFYLSSLQPVSTLKGTFKAKRVSLRRVLVVSQFALSTLAMIGTVVVHQQLEYMRGKELGFDGEQVVVLDTGRIASERTGLLKEALLRHAAISSVSAVSGLPGRMVERMHVTPEGAEEAIPVQMLWVDHDFVETLGIHLVAGRNFLASIATDESEAFLVNEAAARIFNQTDPLEKSLHWAFFGGEREGKVIGIVEDFHLASLREQIAPLVMLINPVPRYLAVRLQADDISGVLPFLEQEWKAIEPGRPLEVSFLDSDFAALYEAEERQSILLTGFSWLTITISCIGLFGLAAFTVAQRRKEISIRKVLGATVSQVLVLFSREYVKLVTIAFLLAAPIAYFAASHWLTQFAYRTELSVSAFIAVGAFILGLTLVTIGFLAMKTAKSDPIHSLCYE